MGEIPHHLPLDPPDGLLMQTFRFRIDRNDPFEMQHLILAFIEDFKIGVDHRPLEGKSRDLPGEDETPPRFEGSPQIGLASLKPFRLEDAVAVVEYRLKDPSPAVEAHLRLGDPAHDGLPEPGDRLRDPANITAVLVASRQEIKHILNGSEVFPGQQFRDPGTDAPDGTDRPGEKTGGLSFLRRRGSAIAPRPGPRERP